MESKKKKKLVTEGRRAPWRFFPRPNASLSVTLGARFPDASLRATLGMGSIVRGSSRNDDGDGVGVGGTSKEGR